MKIRYGILGTSLLLLLSLAAVSQVQADETAFYIRADRPSYVPGDSGTLLITIRNTGTQAFTIKNLTITYSWMAFINDHWEGNETIKSIDKAIAPGTAYNTQRSFTIPNDGRASPLLGAAQATVKAGTDIGGGGGRYESDNAPIPLALPTYQPLGVSSSLLSWLTVGLLVVAVVLLALLVVAIRKMAKK